MSGLRVPVVGPSCHVRHAPHPHNAASFSQRTCIRRFRQNADPFSQNSPISPFFTQLVCTLAAKLRQVAAVPSPIGGNCTTRGCDTPATCRRSASHGAKYPIVASLKCAASPTRLRRSRLVRKTRPASTIMPNLGCIERAGRTFSRSHPHQAVQGEIVRAQDAETWRR